MSRSTYSLHKLGAAIIFTTVLFVTPSWSTEKKLHHFGIGRDGRGSTTGLILDAAGNLYGTTPAGGTHYGCGGGGCGTVFELTPDGGGGWREIVLHRFLDDGEDGREPLGGLIFDAAGNLYGTTHFGGNQGCGTVFELMPDGNGGWTEKKLHNFLCNASDGAFVVGSLVFDTAGNVYGATSQGGDYSCGGYGCGTVFELMPNGHGGWTEKKIHNFGQHANDGSYPQAGLVFDGAGNLYGTTFAGGSVLGSGTAFQLSPNGNGTWTERVIHNFGEEGDGFSPESSLIVDAVGNLYGTTQSGGRQQGGTVFELSPNGHGGWTEKKLHNFVEEDGDGGWDVFCSLAWDAAGNLYGTTLEGGKGINCPYGGCGVVFELIPNGNGWTEKKLHNFTGVSFDGFGSFSGVVLDSAGNVYGTTSQGGDYGHGTVFEIMP